MGILDGIRIIDWSLYHAGPFATALLADLGAEVIHVEEREHGDPMRGNTSVSGYLTPRPGGRQLGFEEHNRNKKGIAIDLNKRAGQEIIYRLAAKSDVFVTNFRRRAATKLHLDFETLKPYNPRLIYCVASSLGDKGPFANRPSVDPIGQAMSGFMTSGGDAGTPPARAPLGIGDRVVSLYLAFGILAALWAREKYGVVQEVSVSQLGSLVNLQGFCVTPALFANFDSDYPRADRNKNSLQANYQCKDSKWICVSLPANETDMWPKLCQTLGIPELIDDPRFADMQVRLEHGKELATILEKAFLTRTRDEWQKIFDQTDLLVTSVLELAEMVSHPQVLANEYICDWKHPVLGPIKFVGPPVKFSEMPAKLVAAAPELGQHNEEVLTAICGYTWEEVQKLRAEEVI